MHDPIHGRMGRHFRKLAQAPGLAFGDIVTAAMISEVLDHGQVVFRDRIYNPAVTLWAWLWQTLSAGHSCGEAVARVLVWREAQGLGPCSANTGSYCEARKRLPRALLAKLLRELGARLHEQTPEAWQWKGRHVKIVDGATVSMPDTKENQQRFPQARTQKPGLGFPVARLVVVFSLTCGAALDLGVGPYKGKKTGENTLFRGLMSRLSPGDVMLADRCYSGYCDVAMLQQRGVDVVVRKHPLRKIDLTRARRLGRDHYLVVWHKPARCPEGMDPKEFEQLPDELELREVTIRVRRKGFRTRTITVVTTLLDAERYTTADLAALLRPAMTGRTGPALAQEHTADGRAALHHAGDDRKGALDAPAGL